MRSPRQGLPGFLIGAVLILLILGSFMISFAENAAPLATGTAPATTSTRLTEQAMNPATNTPLVLTPTRTLVINTSTPTVTSTLTPTDCPRPSGWISYQVKPGDTLEALAVRYKTSVERLLNLNCMALDGFTAGINIFVPPPPTRTAGPCGPPPKWILYPVQPGDTLYRLSVMFAVSVEELQSANCMGTSTLLLVGEWIYVPPWAPILPTATEGPVYTPAPTWTVIVPDPWTPIPTDTPTE